MAARVFVVVFRALVPRVTLPRLEGRSAFTPTLEERSFTQHRWLSRRLKLRVEKANKKLEEAVKKLAEANKRLEVADKRLQELNEKIALMKALLEEGTFPLHGKDTLEMRKEMNIAAVCYESPYEGDSTILKRILEARLRAWAFAPREYYAKYVAVTNSPCLGKTKSVLELGRNGVFVFYCSTAKLETSTYPPRTIGLADDLVSARSTAAMTFYLIAWLRELSAFIRSTQGTDAEKEDLAAEWLRRQERFSERVITDKVLRTWRELRTTLGPKYTGDVTNMAEGEDKLHELLRKEIEGVLAQLQFDDSFEHPRLKLLFVVDEAKGLLQDPEPFLCLRRACQVLGKATLLVVIDASARVAEPAPGGEDDESRRARALGLKLLQPVCRLSNLDLFVDREEAPPGCVRGWLEDPLRWTRYGRPIWALRYGKERKLEVLLNLAQSKLVNLSKVAVSVEGQELQVYSTKLTESQALSMLAFTVGIQIAPAHHLAEDASASNMMVTTSISSDRRAFRTVAPVEPIVSAAAAAFFKDPEVLVQALQLFRKGLKSGYTSMSRGDRAELVVNIHVMLAMWECWKKMGVPHFGSPKCVPTADFVRQLVGDHADKLPSEFEQSLVFFNRILALDHVPSRKETLEYIKRGCACLGTKGNQNRAVDIYVPLLFRSKVDRPVERKQNVQDITGDGGQVPVQGKPASKPEIRDGEYELREDNVSYMVISTEATNPECLRPSYIGVCIQNDLPYITISHSVNAEDGAPETQSEKTKKPQKPLRVLGPAKNLKGFRVPAITGRWGIVIRGLEGPLSTSSYKAAIPVLRAMMEDKPMLSTLEHRDCFEQYCPWMYAEFLPQKLKEQIKTDKELFKLRKTQKNTDESVNAILEKNLHY